MNARRWTEFIAGLRFDYTRYPYDYYYMIMLSNGETVRSGNGVAQGLPVEHLLSNWSTEGALTRPVPVIHGTHRK